MPRPEDTPLTQQRLPSWQPIMTPRVAQASFAALGVPLLALGVARSGPPCAQPFISCTPSPYGGPGTYAIQGVDAPPGTLGWEGRLVAAFPLVSVGFRWFALVPVMATLPSASPRTL